MRLCFLLQLFQMNVLNADHGMSLGFLTSLNFATFRGVFPTTQLITRDVRASSVLYTVR